MCVTSFVFFKQKTAYDLGVRLVGSEMCIRYTTILAVKSTLKGLNKLIINKEAIEKDLEKNWAVVAEAIQTVLRREGYPNPYEALKALTRTNNKITQESIAEFIDTLDISAELKKTLKQITPSNYTGI